MNVDGLFTNASIGRKDATSYSAPVGAYCQDRIKFGVFPESPGGHHFGESDAKKRTKLKAINMRAAAEAEATGLVPVQAERLWPGPLCSVLAWLCLWRVSPKQ